jgi:hypothetical protein
VRAGCPTGACRTGPSILAVTAVIGVGGVAQEPTSAGGQRERREGGEAREVPTEHDDRREE